jgi:hypothetical protein
VQAASGGGGGGGGGGGNPANSEAEPNNTLSAANPITAAGQTIGAVGAPTDQDWFAVDLPAGATMTATMTPNASGDYQLAIYNASGSLEVQGQGGIGAAETLTTTNSSGATAKRYLRVKFVRGVFGATKGVYTLNLAW